MITLISLAYNQDAFILEELYDLPFTNVLNKDETFNSNASKFTSGVEFESE